MVASHAWVSAEGSLLSSSLYLHESAVHIHACAHFSCHIHGLCLVAILHLINEYIYFTPCIAPTKNEYWPNKPWGVMLHHCLGDGIWNIWYRTIQLKTQSLNIICSGDKHAPKYILLYQQRDPGSIPPQLIKPGIHTQLKTLDRHLYKIYIAPYSCNTNCYLYNYKKQL